MPGQPGRERPTDVTAAMKDMNNRARSLAAGVVSGAGWCQPVFETPHFDESAPSRTRYGLDPTAFGSNAEGTGAASARQLKRRVRATGGAGRKGTHERGDGMNRSQMTWWAGGVHATCPLL